MSISAPFIRRPIGTALLALGVALAGIVAYLGLPVAPLPRVDFPTIVVSAQLPGADPEVMAASVAAPLERRLGAIAGVSELTSNSALGNVGIVVQFELSRRIADAAKDVQAAINAAGSDLPPLPNPPSVRRANPADAPVLILAMTSDTVAPAQLYDLADSLVLPRIAQVQGVAQIALSGAEQPAIRVQADPAAAAAAGVSLEEVRVALARANVTAPTGLIDGTLQGGAIVVNDRLTSAEEFARVPVRVVDGTVIRVGDVARVAPGVRDRRQAGSYNGRPAILLIVFKQADANVLEVVDGIRALLPRLEGWLPAGVRIETLRDRTGTIRASVAEVQHALLISIALVVLVVAVFLRRWPAVLAAGVAVPLSLLGTLAGMWLAGFSLNNLSLIALTISVGFVVDDAIVMIENMQRLREEGMAPAEAALEGARQIGFTVVSITVSLIAVLIPLLFMPGVMGRLFREFALTLALAVAISGVVSLTVTPMVAARFGHARAVAPGRLARGFEAALAWVVRGYLRSLGLALRWRRTMVLLTVALVGVTVWLYRVVPKDFIPQQDTGLLFGGMQAPADMSFQRLRELHERAAAIIGADPAVAGVGASISAGGSGAPLNGRFFVSLKPEAERPGVTSQDVINRLRRPLASIPGAQTFLRPAQDVSIGGRAGNATYQYVLLSPDLEALQTWSDRLVERLQRVPELTDVSGDRLRSALTARLLIDRDAAARLGIPVQTLNAALNNAFSQRQVSIIYRTRSQYRVVMELDPALTEDPTQLDRVFLPGRDGVPVPLGAVARVERASAPLAVPHQDQFPAYTITFNLAPGVSLGDASAALEQAALEIGMPASVRGEFAGNARAFRASQGAQPLLILAALACIYIVLGILYESLIHPLTIISTLPTAGIGALLALLATGTPFSVIALIGVILLMGIVKKNAIMMVDFALDHQRSGAGDAEAAILAACRERFRPILMTTLAAIAGAVPLAIASGPGAELRQPLGISIIGGLLLSQVLTLYTTPAVYLAFDRLGRRRLTRLRPAPRG